MPSIEFLKASLPQLIADVTLYRTDQGGKKFAALPTAVRAQFQRYIHCNAPTDG
jgi:hypothetical protein